MKYRLFNVYTGDVYKEFESAEKLAMFILESDCDRNAYMIEKCNTNGEWIGVI